MHLYSFVLSWYDGDFGGLALVLGFPIAENAYWDIQHIRKLGSCLLLATFWCLNDLKWIKHIKCEHGGFHHLGLIYPHMELLHELGIACQLASMGQQVFLWLIWFHLWPLALMVLLGKNVAMIESWRSYLTVYNPRMGGSKLLCCKVDRHHLPKAPAHSLPIGGPKALKPNQGDHGYPHLYCKSYVWWCMLKRIWSPTLRIYISCLPPARLLLPNSWKHMKNSWKTALNVGKCVWRMVWLMNKRSFTWFYNFPSETEAIVQSSCFEAAVW